ncbi:hypothetical protein D9M71_654900 [compost metagenome]
MKIHQLGRGLDAHFDLRVQGIETAQARYQPGGCERRRGADGQGLARRQLLQQCQRCLDLIEALEQPRIHPRAGFAQVHAMAATHEQHHAHARLEQAHLLADRPRRYPHALGGRLEAAQTCRFSEGPQCQQR